MRREEFLGPYRSHQLVFRGHMYYVRGHSPWVELLFHPNKLIHEQAFFMLQTASKYDRRWKWWSLSVPPPLWTLQVEEVPGAPPNGMMVRVLAWLLAFYAAWSAARRN